MDASKRQRETTPALIYAIGMGLLVGLASPAARAQSIPQASPDELRLRNQELEAIRTEQKRATETEAKLRAEIESLGDDRRKLNQALIAAAARTRDAEERVAIAEERINSLGGSERLLRQSLAERQTTMAEVLAALQRIGHRPPPAMLIHPADALRAIRSAILLGAVIPEMRVEADALAADLADLARMRGELASEKEALARSAATLVEERERIALLSDERRKKLAETEIALEAERQKVAALARQADDLKDLIGRTEQGLNGGGRGARADLAALQDPGRLAPAMTFASAQGRLPFPVNGPRIKDFGDPDRLGGSEKGITISARFGAQVTAPCDGWVVYAAPFRNYGQVLILNAGGGYHVVLAGMERIAVNVGQFVLTGEPIAIMGGISGTHTPAPAIPGSEKTALYVEFRKDGVPIDPGPWWAVSKGEKVRG